MGTVFQHLPKISEETIYSITLFKKSNKIITMQVSIFCCVLFFFGYVNGSPSKYSDWAKRSDGLSRLGNWAKRSDDTSADRMDLAEDRYNPAMKRAEDRYDPAMKRAEDRYNPAMKRAEDRYNPAMKRAEDRYNPAMKRAEDRYNPAMKRAEDRYNPAMKRADTEIREPKARMDVEAKVKRVLNGLKEKLADGAVLDVVLFKPKHHHRHAHDKQGQEGLTTTETSSAGEAEQPANHLPEEARYFYLR